MQMSLNSGKQVGFLLLLLLLSFVFCRVEHPTGRISCIDTSSRCIFCVDNPGDDVVTLYVSVRLCLDTVGSLFDSPASLPLSAVRAPRMIQPHSTAARDQPAQSHQPAQAHTSTPLIDPLDHTCKVGPERLLSSTTPPPKLWRGHSCKFKLLGSESANMLPENVSPLSPPSCVLLA